MKQDWQIEETRVTRVRVVGPHEDSAKAFAWLAEQGFHVVRSGPYTDREMDPRVDVTRFLFIAERDAP